MLTRLTLLFTDSFQPISFSSYIFAIVSVLCGVCGGVALELLFFSVATDISKYRTHDTSHASISHINIIFPIHFLQYARIRRERNKKEGCRKVMAVLVVVMVMVTAATIAKSELKSV